MTKSHAARISFSAVAQRLAMVFAGALITFAGPVGCSDADGVGGGNTPDAAPSDIDGGGSDVPDAAPSDIDGGGSDVPDAAEEGIIPNSVDRIWDDMHEPNDAYPVAFPAGYPLFQGPVLRSTAWLVSAGGTKWKYSNVWMAVFEIGSYAPNPQSCGMSLSTATNTRVEISGLMGYFKRKNDNTWHIISARKTQNGSVNGPPGTSLFDSTCYSEDPANRPNPDFVWEPMNPNTPPSGAGPVLTPYGFQSFKPSGQWRWHGWIGRADIRPVSTLQVQWAQMYVRLIVEDDQLPDDRDNAEFVVHICSDQREDETSTPPYKYVSGTGPSRWVKVTKDWQPVNGAHSLRVGLI